MNITLDLRVETIMALDEFRRQFGCSREGALLDIIENALGVTASEFTSMMPNGSPISAEATTGSPVGRM